MKWDSGGMEEGGGRWVWRKLGVGKLGVEKGERRTGRGRGERGGIRGDGILKQ